MADPALHPMHAKMQEISEKLDRLPLEMGGGGNHTGGMEARIAKLEAHVEHIREDIAGIRDALRDLKVDFKIVWAAIFASTLGLAGLLAKGFGWL